MLTNHEMWERIYGDKPYPKDSGRDAWIPNRSECYLMTANGCFDMNTQVGVLEWLHFKINSRIREIQYRVIDCERRNYSQYETAESLYSKKLLAAIDFQNPAASFTRLYGLYASRLQVLLSRALDESEQSDLQDVQTLLNLIQEARSGANASLPPELTAQPEPEPIPEPDVEAPKPKLADVLSGLRSIFLQRLTFLQGKGTKYPGKTPTEEAEQADLQERIRLLESRMNSDIEQHKQLITELQAHFNDRQRALSANKLSTVDSRNEQAELFRVQRLLQQFTESSAA